MYIINQIINNALIRLFIQDYSYIQMKYNNNTGLIAHMKMKIGRRRASGELRAHILSIAPDGAGQAKPLALMCPGIRRTARRNRRRL